MTANKDLMYAQRAYSYELASLAFPSEKQKKNHKSCSLCNGQQRATPVVAKRGQIV